jgi:putative oxidoreductase
MNGAFIRVLTLAGRIALALIFFVSAASKLSDFAGNAARMAARGLPAAQVLLVGACALEIVGAALVVLGLRARIGAWMLIVFLVPTTIVFHNFWAAAGTGERLAQMLQFLKNLSILGGLLLVAAYGAGPLSLDARRRA